MSLEAVNVNRQVPKPFEVNIDDKTPITPEDWAKLKIVTPNARFDTAQPTFTQQLDLFFNTYSSAAANVSRVADVTEETYRTVVEFNGVNLGVGEVELPFTGQTMINIYTRMQVRDEACSMAITRIKYKMHAWKKEEARTKTHEDENSCR